MTTAAAKTLMTLESRDPKHAEFEPVATILAGDPFDERDGPWFSNADLKRLAALPAGTRLYAKA